MDNTYKKNNIEETSTYGNVDLAPQEDREWMDRAEQEFLASNKSTHHGDRVAFNLGEYFGFLDERDPARAKMKGALAKDHISIIETEKLYGDMPIDEIVLFNNRRITEPEVMRVVRANEHSPYVYRIPLRGGVDDQYMGLFFDQDIAPSFSSKKERKWFGRIEQADKKVGWQAKFFSSGKADHLPEKADKVAYSLQEYFKSLDEEDPARGRKKGDIANDHIGIIELETQLFENQVFLFNNHRLTEDEVVRLERIGERSPYFFWLLLDDDQYAGLILNQDVPSGPDVLI